MKKLFFKITELARLCAEKVRRAPKLFQAVPMVKRPQGPVRLSLRDYLALNMATWKDGRIYYPHTIYKLRRLARQHRNAKTDTGRERAATALPRIAAMAKSRVNAFRRCALPKKQQRELGMLPRL